VTVLAPLTFTARWDRTLQRSPEALFFLFHDTDGTTTSWTFGAFEEVVARAAMVLREHGVGPGSALHVALRNCPAFIALWLAAARVGACMVAVDPASTTRDVAAQIRRTSPVIGFCGKQRARTYRDGAAGIPLTIVELDEAAEDVQNGGVLTVGLGLGSSPHAADPGDRLGIMFTSGTTSQPKAVVLTQGNYATVADQMAAAVNLTPSHRWLVTLPLFHANAQYYCFAPAIAVGASVALTATFSASRWLTQAAELQATHASLFAAPIRMILARHVAPPPEVALQHVWFAQSLGVEHYERFADLVGCRPRQLYGMTETIAAVTADISRPLRHDVIGRPLEGRQVAVVGIVDGQPCSPGETGMLLVRGERGIDLFQEYLDDPITTDGVFDEHEDGTWFRTGDLVSADSNRVLRFVGRADDVVKVAGENVSLTEIEAVLAQAPGVLEVAVVARPDPVRDQVPVAYVVARDSSTPPDMNELARWASQHLSPAARPRD